MSETGFSIETVASCDPPGGGDGGGGDGGGGDGGGGDGGGGDGGGGHERMRQSTSRLLPTPEHGAPSNSACFVIV
jgi:hypothetical protein